MSSGEWVSVSEDMPKVGQFVLATFVCSYRGTRQVVRAMRAGRFMLPAAELDDECEYSEADDEYYVPPGWYEKNEMEEVHWKIIEEVTHWMPMPDPPAVAPTS